MIDLPKKMGRYPRKLFSISMDAELYALIKSLKNQMDTSVSLELEKLALDGLEYRMKKESDVRNYGEGIKCQ